jgi:adenylyltransferase/sulfurtransferase
MLSPEEHEIYSRHLILEKIGLSGQLKLKNSSVLVIGAGGLGCPVLQYLAAAGVGTIGIADHDTVEKSNLQRQVLFGHSSLGRLKVDEAKKRLEDLNPFVNFKLFADGITIENATDLVSAFDIIVDCTDNFETRYLINDSCFIQNKPLVYGAIHKFEGQVSVFNLNNGPTYRCLYPDLPDPKSVSNCADAGVIGVLPGVIGTFQANEVIKIITEIGESLNGKILVFNALNNQSTSYNISKSEHEIYNRIKTNGFDQNDYQFQCDTASEIIIEAFLESKSSFEQIIDVREYNEYPIIAGLASNVIPMGELHVRFGEIDPDKKTLVFCKRGIRSQMAIDFLKEQYNYKNLTNLKGGITFYPFEQEK